MRNRKINAPVAGVLCQCNAAVIVVSVRAKSMKPANIHVKFMGISGERSERDGFPRRLFMPTMTLFARSVDRIAALTIPDAVTVFPDKGASNLIRLKQMAGCGQQPSLKRRFYPRHSIEQMNR